MKKLLYLFLFLCCLTACGYAADFSDVASLSPVKQELPVLPEGITMELVGAESEGCKIRYTNHSCEEWYCGDYFRVDVRLQGQWYHVPKRTDTDVEYTFTAMAYPVLPEESREMIYSFDLYGKLPAGDYRVVTDFGWEAFSLS